MYVHIFCLKKKLSGAKIIATRDVSKYFKKRRLLRKVQQPSFYSLIMRLYVSNKVTR